MHAQLGANCDHTHTQVNTDMCLSQHVQLISWGVGGLSSFLPPAPAGITYTLIARVYNGKLLLIAIIYILAPCRLTFNMHKSYQSWSRVANGFINMAIALRSCDLFLQT